VGDKAKTAIKNSQTAMARMQTNANDLVQAYMGMVNQKKITAQFRTDLLAYANKKYPGKADLSAEYATDDVVKRCADGMAGSKAKTREFRQSIMVGTVTLKQNMASARGAMDELNKLITAKAAKKAAAGSNPLKKVAAAVKTKSLGSLRDQKTAIDKALGEVNALTIAIVDYAEKKMRAAG
jgi:hypothetical protein